MNLMDPVSSGSFSEGNWWLNDTCCNSSYHCVCMCVCVFVCACVSNNVEYSTFVVSKNIINTTN